MKSIVDTHFLIWITTGHERLAEFPWLEQLQPFGVSPVSLLEMQFLSEVERLTVDMDRFREALSADPRFMVDEVGLVGLIDQALALTWTRDPFDRLLCAHSAARRLPLVSVDRSIRENHRFLPREFDRD